MIKIHVMHTGCVAVDCAIPHQEKNPLAVTGIGRGKAKKVILPVSCYLIVHPKGKILIDTGWDTVYADKAPHQLFGMINRISKPLIKRDEGVDTKLGQLGYSPSELDKVFLSHMDFDHVSGLRLVKDAKEIMTSDLEWQAANRLGLRYIDAWTGICKVNTFCYTTTGLGPVGASYDVFGDGTIQLVLTPGHSKGLFSVVVSNGEDYVVIASDGAYTQKSFDEKVLPTKHCIEL